MGTGTNVLTALRATPVTMACAGRDDAVLRTAQSESGAAEASGGVLATFMIRDGDYAWK